MNDIRDSKSTALERINVLHMETGRDWREAGGSRASSQPHRNDPCSCGSGHKYKRCCGRGTSEPIRPIIEKEPAPAKEAQPACGFAPISMDEAFAIVARAKLPSPQPMIVRGRECYRSADMLLAPFGAGVLAGPVAWVTNALSELDEAQFA